MTVEKAGRLVGMGVEVVLHPQASDLARAVGWVS